MPTLSTECEASPAGRVADAQPIGVDSIAGMVGRLGGLAQKQSLVRQGATDRMLTVAVSSGAVRRARQGWYSTLEESDPLFRAARVGGRLTGMSALRSLGSWSWDDGPVHISIPGNAARLRDQWNRFGHPPAAEQVGVVLHWEPAPESAGNVGIVSIEEALVCVVLDEPFEVAVAALDWALASGSIDRLGFHHVMAVLPADARMIANWVDARCDSVLESVARTWLRLRGLRVVSQVRVGDLEAIDLVVEGVVALETDGRDHATRFERDRRKDLSITIEGRHAVRATYSMVRYEFDRLEAAIVQAIVARDPSWSVENSGVRARAHLLSRREWRMLNGTVTRLPEFPAGVHRE